MVNHDLAEARATDLSRALHQAGKIVGHLFALEMIRSAASIQPM